MTSSRTPRAAGRSLLRGRSAWAAWGWLGAVGLGGLVAGLAMLLVRPLGAQIPAEGATPPHWIWYPGEKAPGRVTRYFRKAFAVKEPSRLAIEVSGDDVFTLYLDGTPLAHGTDWKASQTVEARVTTGPHVLAAEVTNAEPGPAGFLMAGGVLPLGQVVPIHTNASWKASKTVPGGDAWTRPGFDDATWDAAADLGVVGTEPWAALTLGGGDAGGRFRVPEGFRVAQVAAPGLTGSVVTFTFDQDGAPCVSVERGPVTRLVDADGDGRYEGKVVITPQMSNCQGLYFDVGTDGESVRLWAVGQGPRGTGIHQLQDEDGDGVFEKVLHYVPTDGMGEHGPHAILRGPDGFLYYNNGNHAHLKVPIDPESPVNDAFRYEGELLPHFNDARGHAAGIMAPGGEIYRSDDDGRTWSRIVAGFRNEYDFAFNDDGEVFTFDSDMEWDFGLPWYRPVRVCFCPPGAEFGWRNGSAKWPAYDPDSLPAILDVGRGSPTGVGFYQGNAFPEKYRDAFLFCDWSQGRILAASLRRAGGGYEVAEQWELVTGQPLNATDVEVGPDGMVYFSTGGRGTLGGLYRVAVVASPEGRGEAEATIAGAIGVGSPLSSFGRKRLAAIKTAMGADWDLALDQLVRDEEGEAAERVRALDLMTRFGPQPDDELLIGLAKDKDADVRAKAVQLLGMRSNQLVRDAIAGALDDPEPFVRRRACEALVRSGDPIPVERVLPLLGDPDRWVRYAARVTVEHGDPGEYRDEILGAKPDRRASSGCWRWCGRRGWTRSLRRTCSVGSSRSWRSRLRMATWWTCFA